MPSIAFSGRRFVRSAAVIIVGSAVACQNTSTNVSLSNFDTLVITPVDEVIEGTVGEPTAFRVRVSDETGRTVSDAPVSLAVLSPTGFVSPSIARTDDQGIVEAIWVLGATAGDQSLEVTGNDARQSRNFRRLILRARATASEPYSVEVTPSGAALELGESAAFRANVADRYGNPLQSNVDWEVADTGVARVDSRGLVTAVGEGSTPLVAVAETSTGSRIEGYGWISSAAAPGSDGDAGGDGGGTGGSDGTGGGGSDGGGGPVGVDPPPSGGDPVPDPVGQIADLAVVSTTEVTALLRFTEVDDGTGRAANYSLQAAPLSPAGAPGPAAAPGAGGVIVNVLGGQVGALRQHEVTGLAAGSTYGFSVVPYRLESDGTSVYGSSSNVVSAATQGAPSSGDGGSSGGGGGGSEPPAPPVTVTVPGTVANISVVSSDANSVVLRFTQVSNGAGQPANYAIRHGSPTIAWWSASSTERTISGTAIGANLEYRYTGLSSSSTHQFQIVAYRGTLNQDAVFGEISSKATATTAAAAPSGSGVVATVEASASSHQFAALGATKALSAAAYTAGGAAVPGTTFAWRSLNSTIASVNGNGLVTARAIGSTAIVVAATCCSQAADTIAVTVSQLPTSILVSPTSVALDVGESQTLTAGVLDANDFPLSSVLVQWSSTNTSVATVTSGGRVSGVSGGTATVRARFSGLTGTASAQVVAAAPPPSGGDSGGTGGSTGGSTGGGGQGGANEPAGYAAWRNWTMEDESARPIGGPQTYTSEGGNTFARYTWASGFIGGQSIGYFNTGFGPGECATQFYLRFDYRRSSNWTWHSAGNKIVYLVSSAFGGNGPLYLNGRSTNSLEIAQQNAGPSMNYGATGSSDNQAAGQWHTIEVHVRGDGYMRLWNDGQLTHDYGRAGGVFPSSANVCFDRVNFDAVWGGIGESVQSTQHLDFDNIYISKP